MKRTISRISKPLRVIIIAIMALALVASSLSSATALTFDTDSGGVINYPDAASHGSPFGNGAKPPTDCPTTVSAPRSVEAWMSTDDAEIRGYWDPKNHEPWTFASRISQIICSAKKGATVHLGYYFLRAIGTTARPESDTEVIFDALEWVARNRSVKVEIVLDLSMHGKSIRSDNTKRLITRIPNAKVKYCANGCFNYNNETVYYAILHEKYILISDTTWANSNTSKPHPVVLSSSGNLARSQIRNYFQEVTVVYDDLKLWQEFEKRHQGLMSCANSKAKGCSSKNAAIKALNLKSQKKIWVDPQYRRYTDAQRGTSVSFVPQPYSTPDFYVTQFGGVDCSVDKKIRIAMFKMTFSKAEALSKALAKLKKAGCDIQLLMSSDGGSHVVDQKVIKTLKKAIGTDIKCSPTPMHTKMVLIGPMQGNEGRIMVGTSNFTTSGLRWSDEHVLTFDTRRAEGKYQTDLRRAYGQYLDGFEELSQGSAASHC